MVMVPLKLALARSRRFLVAAALLLGTATPSQAAPANDNIANALAIGPGTYTVDLTTATAAIGEPLGASAKSVWYTYTPTSDVTVKLDSTGTQMNRHFIRVYSSVTTSGNIGLAVLRADDSGSSRDPFNFSLKVKAGSKYYIYVGTTDSISSGESGTCSLSLSTKTFSYLGQLFTSNASTDGGISNDTFANSTQVTGATATIVDYVYNSSTQAFEPLKNLSNTVWYSYKATKDSIVKIDTTGSELPFLALSVFTGDTIDGLNFIEGRKIGSAVEPFSFSFRAKEGNTYRILAGYDDDAVFSYGVESLSSQIFLTLTTKPLTYTGTLIAPPTPEDETPLNDSYANALTLPVNKSLTVLGYPASATNEPGDKQFTNNNGNVGDPKHTLWYKFTPTANGFYRFDLDTTLLGFDFGTGGSIDTFKSATFTAFKVGSTWRAYFPVKRNVTYRLVVGSSEGRSNPPNYQFALAPVVNKDKPKAVITSPKNGQTIKKFYYFNINAAGSDADGVTAIELRIDGQSVGTYTKITKVNATTSRFAEQRYFTAAAKTGKHTIQVRARDSLGVWGPLSTVTVNVK